MAPVVRQLASSETTEDPNELETLAERISVNKRLKDDQQKAHTFLKKLRELGRYSELVNLIQSSLDYDKDEKNLNDISERFRKRRKISDKQPIVKLQKIANFMEKEGLVSIADELNEVSSDLEKEIERKSSVSSDETCLTEDSVRTMIDQALRQPRPLTHTPKGGTYDEALRQPSPLTHTANMSTYDQALRQPSPLTHTANMSTYDQALRQPSPLTHTANMSSYDQALRQPSPLAHTANMSTYGNSMLPFHLPSGRQSQSRDPHLLHLINQAYHAGHDQGMDSLFRNYH